MKSRHHTLLLLAAASATLPAFAPASADDPLLAGSPPFQADLGTGYQNAAIPGMNQAVNDLGMAVGSAHAFLNGADKGARAIRWNIDQALELGNLGTCIYGNATATAVAINDAGTAVGNAHKYVGTTDKGARPVRWDPAASIAIELGNLGTNSSGFANAEARALNAGGTVVGFADKYVRTALAGARAVRWEGTTPIELGTLGTDAAGCTSASASSINDAGTAVGYALKYASGANLGARAVRWDAATCAAVELATLGTDASGYTDAYANKINAAGTVAGLARKFVNGADVGYRPVRWDAGAITELGTLGTDAAGSTTASVFALNAGGIAVGYVRKYVDGVDRGFRAVRWDRADAIELATLGTDNVGVTQTYAYALNAGGAAVGSATKYASSSYLGDHAVLWLADASVVDLNDLDIATPGGTWTLTSAKAITDNGWIAGEGTFDPTGPLPAYSRLWVAQVGLGGTWRASTSAAWSSGGNWSSGTPAIQGDARFTADATVTCDGDQRCRNLVVEKGRVTLALGGHALKVSQSLTIAGTLTLAPSSDVCIVSSLALAGSTDAWTGTLDLADNGLVVATIDDKARATLKNQIVTARNSAWLGHGITSSTAALAPSRLAVALADNADLHLASFRGQSVDDTALFIAAVPCGDANLDGAVDAFDLNLLAAHWQQTDRLWSAGDFTGDGKVDAFDLNVLASHWQFGSAAAMSASSVDAAGSFSVPEPASLLLALACLPLLLHRRR